MFNYENNLTVLYMRNSRLCVTSQVYVYSVSVTHILPATSFGSGFKPPSGLIQELRFSTTKKKKTLNLKFRIENSPLR